MNDQLARSLFMDYLYDEIETSEKEKLEHYLQQNPELRKELETLQETRLVLQQMPDADPAHQLLMIEPRERSLAQWWQEAKCLLPKSIPGKTAFAAAAALLLFFLAGSLARLQIDASESGVAISLGNSSGQSEALSPEQAEALISQIKEENAAMLSEYAEAIHQQNEQQLQQVVGYFEEQRMNDLRLVNQTLNELQQNTNYRISRTNEYLAEVLQTVSYENQN